jgi:sialate O-acetylesterase
MSTPGKTIFQISRIFQAIVFLTCACISSYAEVKPNGLFTDGVVLQQRIRLPVWGSAKDGERVTVRFQGQTVTTTARHGRWMLHLKPLKAGGPFIMSITGENVVTITNILVGEVWLCSGQSNMEMPLAASTNSAEIIDAANDSQLRFFTVPHKASDEPSTDVTAKWTETTPGNAKYFSAVAYFFGRNLRQTLNVPIGLIHSSVGGTPAEAWTPNPTLEGDPELKQILERQAKAIESFDPAEAESQNETNIARAKAEGKDVTKVLLIKSPAVSINRPAGLYNAMIAPLQPFAIAGVIWYQGESNKDRAAEYRKLFPALIYSWREAWGQGRFPFLFVQIAPHRDMTPEIREAQLLTWQKVPRTAMAVITDVGDANNIHPTRKEPVGTRLALAARAIAYGEKIEYSGPVYDSMELKGDHAILKFTHVDGGLVAGGGELEGFTIAGKDGKFVDATAEIEGDKVIVSSPLIAKPTAVRYGWANVPVVNLFNRQGIPATPFRTDVR